MSQRDAPLSPTDAEVRFGILGTARIATKLVPAIQQASGARLSVVASRDGERARQWARAEGVPLGVEGYRRVLADPELAKTHHRTTYPYKKGWPKTVQVWPHLLKREFLAMVIVTIILIVWSICLDAPLEDPANPNLTMNPSKAPWYFLGLQEMLVYYDP